MERRMSKTKKRLTALALVTCIVGSGIAMVSCAGIGDYVPETYGEWENNYVYRGNVRSRTTGEDWSYLVTEVEIGGEPYEVLYCSDYEILDDDVYMCLGVAPQEAVANGEEKSCLVKYSTLYKTQELIYVEQELPAPGASEEESEDTVRYGAYTIERLDEAEILLAGSSVWYTIDHEGNIIDEDVGDYNAYMRVGDQYMVEVRTEADGQYLYCTSFDWAEPVLVAKLSGTSNAIERSSYEYIKKNGAEGFLIETYDTQNDGVLSKLEFFDLNTRETTLLLTGKADMRYQWVKTPSKEFLIAYRPTTVTYKQRGQQFGLSEEYTANVNLDCVLYQIQYEPVGTKLTIPYEFDKTKDFSSVAGVMGDTVYVFGYWYESAAGCSKGGSNRQYYSLDLGSKTMKTISSSDYSDSAERCEDYNDRQTGIVCGSYVYYLQRIELNNVLGQKQYAYRLKRYDATSGVTDVMQLWKQEGLSQETGVKFCEAMWFSNGGSGLEEMSKFIVRED